MVMKEKDARTKWCPFAREIDYTTGADGVARPVTVNRNWNSSAPSPGSFCIASQCMAWQALSDNSGGYCGLTR